MGFLCLVVVVLGICCLIANFSQAIGEVLAGVCRHVIAPLFRYVVGPIVIFAIGFFVIGMIIVACRQYL